MKFTFTEQKNATKVHLVHGSLTKFVDKVVAQELHIGTGVTADAKTPTLSKRKLILLARKVVVVAKQYKLTSIALEWSYVRNVTDNSISDFELGDIIGTAFEMANYDHTTYKTAPKEGFASVTTVAVGEAPKEALAGIARGQAIAEEVNACRELSNTPGGDMTPKTLAQAAKKAVLGTKATCKVLGRKEMEKLGMGAVLGVAKGSAEEPQFIVMEYWGLGRRSQTSTSAGKSDFYKPIVLVGKGVTFDTGGLNIKTGDGMYEMHMDMSGGAAVIHAVALAAKLKLKKNVIGLVPAVENAASDKSMRPGDILKSMSGKTIEVLNTDAEGRIILADGVTYAQKYNPSAIVDVATLTGAALIALGLEASAFMTNDESKIVELMQLGEKSGDYMWPFPAWEEYEAMTKGTFGDVPNLSTDGNSRWGGVIAGGMFIKEFVKESDCLWVHIDMAPRMTSTSHEYLSKGAAGAPVRFLLAMIEGNAGHR